MTDRDDRGGDGARADGRADGKTDRSPQERQRFKKLAQAALNADVTVGQVNDVLVDLGEVLGDMSTTIAKLDSTVDDLGPMLARFTTTLDNVDTAVLTLGDVATRLERVVTRVEVLVAIGEAALRPLGVIESAGRSVASKLGLG